VPETVHRRHNRRVTILLYDGVCGLCSRMVQFVLRRDRRKIFRFAALQSSFAREVLERHAIPVEPMETFYVVESYRQAGERVLAKSDATIFVFRKLGGLWRLAVIGYAVPPALRDGLYDFVARRRYRWFGQSESCWLPAAGVRDRFLDLN